MYTAIQNKKPSKNNSNSKYIIGLIALVLAIAVGAGAYWKTRTEPPQQTNTATTPATEQEKQETEDHKDDLAEGYSDPSKPTPHPSSSPTGQPSDPGSGSKKPVNVTVTYAGQFNASDDFEAGSYVEGVFEDDGTCTVTLTRGTQQLSKSAAGSRDVNKTLCPVLVIPRAEIPETGDWDYVVKYDSPTATGVSASGKVNIK